MTAIDYVGITSGVVMLVCGYFGWRNRPERMTDAADCESSKPRRLVCISQQEDHQ